MERSSGGASRGWDFKALRLPPVALAETYAERFVWSLRRECLDRLIIFNDWHACRVLPEYARYGLISPLRRMRLSPGAPNLEDLSASSRFREVRGLHHRYEREAAWPVQNDTFGRHTAGLLLR